MKEIKTMHQLVDVMTDTISTIKNVYLVLTNALLVKTLLMNVHHVLVKREMVKEYNTLANAQPLFMTMENQLIANHVLTDMILVKKRQLNVYNVLKTDIQHQNVNVQMELMMML